MLQSLPSSSPRQRRQPPSFVLLPGCQVYTDGSCSRPPFRDHARAAWSVVAVDGDGNELAWTRGTVPAPWPQTAPAAEFTAMFAAAQAFGAQALPTVAVDCKAVVQAAAGGPAGRSGPLAGIWRMVQALPSTARGACARHVKSHRNLADAPQGTADWLDIKGNDIADFHAKEANKAHGTPSPAVQRDHEIELAKVKRIIGYVAVALSGWDKCTKRHVRAPRRRAPATEPPPPPQAPPPPRRPHVWEPYDHFRRCVQCLRRARLGTAEDERAECPGLERRMAASVADRQRLGHSLVLFDLHDKLRPLRDDWGFVMACSACGSWTTAGGGNAKSFQQECPRVRTRSAQQAWNRMGRGLYPHSSKPHVLVGPGVPISWTDAGADG